ncbi:MAG: calcium:proton antiporter, partial [Brevibacterium sp.]|nr:calcium:proton antiporter [Brevibacterium sp.]
MTAAVRSILTPTAIIRLVLGWGVFAALLLAGSLLAPPVAGPLLVTALIAIVGVILICAFGVVHEAEHLARRLGDPYGSLVLTLSIVLIEVVLIAAVLLGPGEHATIARDSVMAVSMIILGAVIGLCLLVAGLRHGSLAHNRTGVSTYLSLIIVLAALAFALPALIGTNGSYQTWQEIPIIVLTIGIYAFFLYRQMGAQAADFHEVDPRLTKPAEVAPESASTTVATTQKQGIVAIISAHRAEIIVRLALLITTVTPIVLLSHDMASLLDDGLGRLGAPVA